METAVIDFLSLVGVLLAGEATCNQESRAGELPVSRRVVPGGFHRLLESIVEVLLLAARRADLHGGGVHEVAHILVLAGPSLVDEDV